MKCCWWSGCSYSAIRTDGVGLLNTSARATRELKGIIIASVFFLVILGALFLAFENPMPSNNSGNGKRDKKIGVIYSGKPVFLKTQSDEWVRVPTPCDIFPDSTVRIEYDDRAEIISGKRIIRMNGSCEIRFHGADISDLNAELIKGEVYLRNGGEAAMKLKASELTAVIEKGVLNAAFHEESIDIYALEGTSKISLEGFQDDSIFLTSDEVLSLEYGSKKALTQLVTVEMPKESIDWLIWNREMDSSLGYGSSFLSQIEQEAEPYSIKIPLESRFLTVSEDAGKARETKAERTVLLKADRKDNGVLLKLEISEERDIEWIEILRSKSSSNPLFPDNAHIHIGDIHIRSHFDQIDEEAAQLFYRAAVKYTDSVIYSETIEVRNLRD